MAESKLEQATEKIPRDHGSSALPSEIVHLTEELRIAQQRYDDQQREIEDLRAENEAHGREVVTRGRRIRKQAAIIDGLRDDHEWFTREIRRLNHECLRDQRHPPALTAERIVNGCMESEGSEATEEPRDSINPAHYRNGFEVFDVVEAWGLDSYAWLATALKYIARCNHKHEGPEKQIEDIRKARRYLDREIERRERHLSAAADD